MSSDYIKKFPYNYNDDGIEDNDDDKESENLGLYFDERDLRIVPKTVSIFQIEHWIREGSLELNPDFQRNLVWDTDRKTALIESILLNIPIPAFYFDEDFSGKKRVIDGVQRLSTIHDYLMDGFQLKKLQYCSECEGKKFSSLSNNYQSRIMNTYLAVYTLDERCSPLIKMDLFRRLNTGGIHLNPQEIRNSLANPSVRSLLKAMSTSEEFRKATGGRVQDNRMQAQEMCLRYLAIAFCFDFTNYYLVEYRGMLKMLDSAILRLNSFSESVLRQIYDDFCKVMNQCIILGAPDIFCKPNNHRINKALFTGWGINLLKYDFDVDYLKSCSSSIKLRFDKVLINNANFYNSISYSTGLQKNIQYSILVIRRILEEQYDNRF